MCAVIRPVGGAAELHGDAAVPPIGVDAALLRPTAVGPLLALIHVWGGGRGAMGGLWDPSGGPK